MHAGRPPASEAAPFFRRLARTMGHIMASTIFRRLAAALSMAALACGAATVPALADGPADGEVIGSVDPVGRTGVMTGTARPGSRIAVEDQDGQDVTSAVTGEDGSFSVALPSVTNLSEYGVVATIGDESQSKPLSSLADSATLDWLGSDKAEYTRQLLAYASQGRAAGDGGMSSDAAADGSDRMPRPVLVAAGAASAAVLVGVPAGAGIARAARKHRRRRLGSTRPTVEIPPIGGDGANASAIDTILSRAEEAGDDDLERLAFRTDAMTRLRDASGKGGSR